MLLRVFSRKLSMLCIVNVKKTHANFRWNLSGCLEFEMKENLKDASFYTFTVSEQV